MASWPCTCPVLSGTSRTPSTNAIAPLWDGGVFRSRELKRAHERLAVRAAEAGAGVPAGLRLVGPVVTHRDVAKGLGRGRELIELRRQETDRLALGLETL